MVPDFRKKVVAVSGDCSQIRLGLSDETYDELTKTINVVIHGAATVRFDEKIRMATHINVRGVREILEFSRNCQNLKVFDLRNITPHFALERIFSVVFLHCGTFYFLLYIYG